MQGISVFGDASEAVWQPGETELGRSRLAAAMKRWGHPDIESLHAASVDDPERFWRTALDDLDVVFSRPFDTLMDDSAGKEFPRWFVGGGLNVVTNCVTRHAEAPYADKPAVVHEGDGGERRGLSYRELGREVEWFAANLRSMGVVRGDRVALFLPVVPESVVAFVACAKLGAIVVPAFSGYGAEALAARLRDSGAKVLVTADGTTRRGKPVALKQVADLAVAEAPSIERVVVVRCSGAEVEMHPGRDVFWDDLSRSQTGCPTEELDPNAPLVIVYTSGTTGAPKGIVHSHGGFLAKAALDFGYGFDVQREDVIGWIADLGWMLGPLLILGGLHFGATIVLTEGVPDHPDRDRLWRIVERNGVTLQGIAPTAARGLMAQDDGSAPVADVSTLRAFASTGEAWDEASWRWLFERIGGGRLPVLNYCGGTEVGGGILTCYTILPQRPGGFCGPALGMDATVLDAEGSPARGAAGELAILNTWPGMTHGFRGGDARYLETYWSRWPGIWVHGDLARVDEHGHWWVHGRSDDTIKIAGRRVGPAEIETGLTAHPQIAEAAVIGVPDPLKGQRIVGFVVLREGSGGFDEAGVREVVTGHVGKSLVPSQVHVVSALPKTKNGKIMRRAIRARCLDQPVGDLSALDAQSSLDHIPRAAEAAEG